MEKRLLHLILVLMSVIGATAQTQIKGKVCDEYEPLPGVNVYIVGTIDGGMTDTDGLFSTQHIHESYATVMVSQLLDSYVGSVRAYLASGADMSEAQQSAADAVLSQAEVTIARSKGSEDLSEASSTHFRARSNPRRVMFSSLRISVSGISNTYFIFTNVRIA